MTLSGTFLPGCIAMEKGLKKCFFRNGLGNKGYRNFGFTV